MRQICPTNSHAAFDTGTKGRTDDGTNLTWELRGILAFLPATPVAQSPPPPSEAPPAPASAPAGVGRSLGKALLRQASDEGGNEQNMKGIDDETVIVKKMDCRESAHNPLLHIMGSHYKQSRVGKRKISWSLQVQIAGKIGNLEE